MTEKALKKIKIILDVEEQDELLTIYMESATDYIIDHTGLKEIPLSLQSVVIDMTVFQYRNRELENVTSESIGSMSYSFVTEYPSNITDRLNSHKRVTVV